MKLKGFTLIELIVVMGILAILATIVVIAVNPGRQFAASRNAKRASDVRAIAQALDQYAAGNNGNAYASITTTPQNIGTSALDLTSLLVPNYLSAIPFDPANGSASDTKYAVFKDANERVSVVSTQAEQGRTIGYGATPNLAAQFVAANNEYLSKSYVVAPNLNTGWISYWFYRDAIGDHRRHFEVGQNAERIGVFDRPDGTLALYSVVGNNIGININTPALANQTWYHIIATWGPSGGQLYLNGALSNNTTGDRTLALPSTGVIYLGNYVGAPSSTYAFNGRLDNVAIGSGALDANARTSLYNNGTSKSYGDITATEKSTWGLISWWNLDEDSGTRRDSHGDNHLTDNNTVTDAAGR